jgi:hypothetical protein
VEGFGRVDGGGLVCRSSGLAIRKRLADEAISRIGPGSVCATGLL